MSPKPGRTLLGAFGPRPSHDPPPCVELAKGHVKVEPVCFTGVPCSRKAGRGNDDIPTVAGDVDMLRLARVMR